MLYTDILEPQSDAVYPDGYRHDRSLDPIRKEVAEAAIFVLDEQAVAMAANVSFSKPSSIVKSLPFVRLPFEKMWIEFANQQLRNATARLGSTNIKASNTTVQIERTAFLLWIEDGHLMMEYIHRDVTPSGMKMLDASAVRGTFDLSSDIEVDYSDMPRIQEALGTGKVRKQMTEMIKSEDEAKADHELRSRFKASFSPNAHRLMTSLSTFMPKTEIQKAFHNQAEEMYRMFARAILPALILINCRNAVDVERVQAPEKLNKARQKKGKPVIREHRKVTIHLSPSKRYAYEKRGTSTTSAEGALVIGHFKVRKTGIWWWNPHWRGPQSDTFTKPIYQVTR